MFSSTHQTSLNYKHKKENPAKTLLNHTRAAFGQMESDPVEKSYSPRFVRLDSLEGACFTQKMPHQQPHESLMEDVGLKQPPTKAEKRWFGNYNSYNVQNGHRRSFRDNPTATSSFTQSFYNSGFYLEPHSTVQPVCNLTKGYFDCFTMDPRQEEAVLEVFTPANGCEYQAQIGPLSAVVVEIVLGGCSSLSTNTQQSTFFEKPSSTLNPNAKVFTPPLNPNAKEFTPAKRDDKNAPRGLSAAVPSSSSTPSTTTAAASSSKAEETPPQITPSKTFCHEKEPFLEQKKVFNDSGVCGTNLTPSTSARSTPVCVTPEMEDPLLKVTSERLSTPWIAVGGAARAAHVVDETDEETFECEIGSTMSYDDRMSDSDNDDDDCDEFASKSDMCDESKDCCRRQRSLSSCSDESFIEFTASSPGESPVVVTCDKSKYIGSRVIEAVDSDDESDEDSEAADNEEFDENEQSDANVDLDEEAINYGFQCPLDMSALTNGSTETVDSAATDSPTQKSSKRFVIENVAKRTVDDFYPSLNQTSKDDAKRRIRDANDAWSQSYDVFERQLANDVSKRTTFTSQDEWETIYEDPDLSEDLRLARTSDNTRRKADHERMERLLGPIFEADHRSKMWNLIRCCDK